MLRIVETRYDGALVQPRHAHDFASVTLILGGSLKERAGSAEVIAESLGIVVKPAHTEHANQFGPQGAHALQIAIDEQSARALADADRRFADWRWIHAGPATPAFLSLLRLVRLGAGNDDAIQRAACDALAAVDAPPLARARAVAPGWLRAIRERLDDEESAASVNALAREADVHPVSLARSFRRHFGCSITEYTQRRRVQRAARRIGDGAGSLSAVACATGFFDQAHMCRAFRRNAGMSPSEFRALVSSG